MYTGYVYGFCIRDVYMGCTCYVPKNVWHWGGRSSPRAERSRYSVSIEFQSKLSPRKYNQPLQNPLWFPDFDNRLRLIGKQLSQYVHMQGSSSTVDVEIALSADILNKLGDVLLWAMVDGCCLVPVCHLLSLLMYVRMHTYEVEDGAVEDRTICQGYCSFTSLLLTCMFTHSYAFS